MSESPERVPPSDADVSVFEAIYGLRATRRYKPDPIPPPVLDQWLKW